jgi:hypothetical protein
MLAGMAKKERAGVLSSCPVDGSHCSVCRDCQYPDSFCASVIPVVKYAILIGIVGVKGVMRHRSLIRAIRIRDMNIAVPVP